MRRQRPAERIVADDVAVEGLRSGQVGDDTVRLLAQSANTFAGAALQAFPVDNRDLAALVADKARLLQPVGYQADGWPSHGKHLSEEIVRQADHVVVDAIPHLNDPAAQAAVGGVKGVACRRLLHLRQHQLAAQQCHLPQQRTFVHGTAEVGHGHAPSRRIDLDDGAHTGGVVAEGGKRPQNGFPTERRGFDRCAILHHGDKGSHAAFDEVNVLNPLLRFLQDGALG